MGSHEQMLFRKLFIHNIASGTLISTMCGTSGTALRAAPSSACSAPAPTSSFSNSSNWGLPEVG